MRGEQILDALEQVDEELLYEIQCVRQRRNKRWRVLVPLAACLCLVMAGTVVAQPWRSLTPFKGLSNQEESNQIEMENGSAGVYVPPLEVDVGADAAVEADMVGFFIYRGRSYVECSWIQNGSHLVGEKLGSSDGRIDEWTPGSGYVEGSGSAWGDFYAVNGYDPAHLLCMTGEDGAVTLYWNSNDITVNTGSDVLETVFHLPNQVTGATIQGTTMQGGTSIAHMDELNAWVGEMCHTPAVSADEANVTWADAQGHLYLKKEDGVVVHLMLYHGGYVKVAGLEQVCWQLDWTSIAQWKK